MSKTHLRTKPKAAAVPEKAPAVEPVVSGIEVVQAIPIDNLNPTDNDTSEDEEADDLLAPDGPEDDGDNTSEGDEEDDDADPDLSALEEAPAAKKSNKPDVEETAFLQIFRTECLQCKALVPVMKHTYRECHYSKGNKACPARCTQIIERVPLNEIVPRWLGAEKAGEWDRIARMAGHLATKPDWFQQRVKDALDNARNGLAYE